MFTSLLIATDGSELGDKAVAAGIALAKAHGSRITIVTATDPVATGLGSGSFGSIDAAPIIARLEDDYADEAQKLLTHAGALVTTAGLVADTLHVPRRRPADAILEVVEERGCDTVVMGSHGRRGIGRLLLGSQAAEVLSRSPVPVLIVK
jgi:nucleotide-binding universal stress UspA family protein